MLGFHQQHHQQAPHLLQQADVNSIPGGGGQEETENYLRKWYQEDLFKEEGSSNNTQQGEGTSSPNSSHKQQFKQPIHTSNTFWMLPVTGSGGQTLTTVRSGSGSGQTESAAAHSGNVQAFMPSFNYSGSLEFQATGISSNFVLHNSRSGGAVHLYWFQAMLRE